MIPQYAMTSIYTRITLTFPANKMESKLLIQKVMRSK